MDAIVEKFKESEKFFKGAKLAISFEGRKLTHDEEMAIIDAVTSNTGIEILCIVDHDPDHEAYVKQQIDEYQASVDFVNENTDDAAELIGGYDIVKAPVAKKALPYCNITLLRGEDMRSAVSGYWNVLFEADPKAVGGTLPDDGAFYMEMINE